MRTLAQRSTVRPGLVDPAPPQFAAMLTSLQKWEDLSGGQGPVPPLLHQELPLEPASRDHRPCHTWLSPAPAPDPQNTIKLSFLGSVFQENLLRSHSWLGQALEATASPQSCTTELLG